MTKWTAVNHVLLIYVSLSDGAGASVVIVLASRVAGGVASAW